MRGERFSACELSSRCCSSSQRGCRHHERDVEVEEEEVSATPLQRAD